MALDHYEQDERIDDADDLRATMPSEPLHPAPPPQQQQQQKRKLCAVDWTDAHSQPPAKIAAAAAPAGAAGIPRGSATREERKQVLKMSIGKLRQIDDPEVFLRRSVLIHNTMQKLQREVKEEKQQQRQQQQQQQQQQESTSSTGDASMPQQQHQQPSRCCEHYTRCDVSTDGSACLARTESSSPRCALPPTTTMTMTTDLRVVESVVPPADCDTAADDLCAVGDIPDDYDADESATSADEFADISGDEFGSIIYSL
ncbi:PREDICTED: putative uncharacterized protein DDB_G0271606 isoform X2 [Priapulus caudatus]|uniref:SERTA domain-containing protein n=1 Tax=Priapulus caudatus TaxID=37621 RepID=A0ABM1E062_PRICU|nr:PREDICTED: putative uncharacterized protein DDB_G0271606 isoform X2 [Priapulus caudatus]